MVEKDTISINDKRIRDYLTPYHYQKPVLSGSGKAGRFDEKAVDIPFVFFHGGKYYMVYTGFDGIGYQSALAQSDDLFHWEFYCMILERHPKTERWDRGGGAVTWLIKENDDLRKVPCLKKVDGKYWMIYHAYPGTGYEAGSAEIGIAWCETEDLKTWNFLEYPVFSWKDGASWEKGGLYKACVIWEKDMWYLFYNAKNKENGNWNEQIGVAFSKDLLHWERYAGNPVLRNGKNKWDCTFVADPYVVKDGDIWLCFYYGIGLMDPEDDLYHAEDGLAISEDLLHWTKVSEPVLRHGDNVAYDNHHAHKPSVFYKDGALYHFYCGTCKADKKYPTELFDEYRTICVAVNQESLLENR